MKPSGYIFDIDGTLALRGDRGPFDWDKVSGDTPNKAVIDLCKLLKNVGFKIIVVSGRDDSCLATTSIWLQDNGISPSALFMRRTGDYRKDYVIKMEIYKQLIEPKYNVLAVFDDRSQVVEMWRSIGLTCFQVADGNF